MQGVRRLVEALNLSTKVERLKDCCCRGHTELKNQILEVFERFGARSARRSPFKA
jgi:hypothetical protein